MILAKYNTAFTYEIPIVKRGSVDFAVGADWTPSAGDVKVSKDGGAAANIGTLPVAIAMGNTAIWQFVLTNTEMTAARVVITVADSATKAVEDQVISIGTFGNASAHVIFDLGTALASQTVGTATAVTTVNGLAANTITATSIAADAITAAKIAADAIGATEIADGAIDAATFAAGAINAAAIAADAITDAKVAADVTIASVTGAVGSVTGAVGSVTGAVGSVAGNVGGNVTGTVGSVVGAVGSVTGNVGGNVTGSVGSLAAQAKTDVNGEVLDVLTVDTFAEPTSAPAATTTLKNKIGWMFKQHRNRVTQTATTSTLYADDGTTADSTSTVSDDAVTFVRGEWT